MDLNLVVLAGRLAAEPEVRVFDSGSRLVRMLVAIRSEQPRRRIDVIPVTIWDPPAEVFGDPPVTGARLWAAGAVQRRFRDGPEGRRSHLEVVADHVRRLDADG